MIAADWISILIVFVCLLLSAFFSSSETALTTSSRATMHRLEQQGDKRAAIVNRLQATRERLIPDGERLPRNDGQCRHRRVIASLTQR